MFEQRIQIHDSLPGKDEPRFAPGVDVKKRIFRMLELKLQCGQTLKNVEVGYETYGHLNERGDNAVLIAHYFTGTSHAAGRYLESDAEPGYWDALIGPGKAIDTDRYFVVSCDSLCNINTKSPRVVTTGPCSIHPDTGRPYGKDFPIVTIGDFVNVQKALADALGVRKFHAVAGPSMGSFQVMEWAASYPEMVERVISVIPGHLSTEAYLIAVLDSWMAPILLDPLFKNGDYTPDAEPIAGLTQALKLVTLNAVHYKWARRLFNRRWADPDLSPLASLDNRFSIEVALDHTASQRARIADANSMLRLARAVQLYSIEDRKERLRSKFLIIPAESDLLMFPDYAERGVRELQALGLSAELVTLAGDGGHLDGLNVINHSSDAIRRFLET